MNNKRVLNNAAWIIGCRIVQAVLGMVVTMLSARFLGPSGYGIINYAASVVTFVVPVMQLGLNSTLVREIINAPDNEGVILGTSIVMNFVSGICCIAGVIAFSAIANMGEPVTIAVCALYSIQLVFQSIDIIQYWFQAKLLSKYTAVAVLVAYAVMSAYKIILLVKGSSIYWFALAQSLDYCVIAAILMVIYLKVGTAKLSFSWKVFKQLFSRSKYYIVSSLMVTVFAQTDRIMLKLMIDEAAVGYYSAAVTCAGMTGFVFAAVIDSARPVILETSAKGTEKFEKAVSTLYCIIIYMSILQCVVITFGAKWIIQILYGAEYALSVDALQLVVWYTAFSYLGSVRNIWILSKGKQRYLWIVNISGAVLNIVLNSVLIPVLGICGAALASLLTQIFANVVIGIIIKPIRRNNVLMLKGLDIRLLKAYITG